MRKVFIPYFQTVLSTVGLIVTALYFMKEDQKTVTNLGYLVLAGSIYALVVLHLFLGALGIQKVWNFIFRDQIRVSIYFLLGTSNKY